ESLTGVARVERYRQTLYTFAGEPVVLSTFSRVGRPDGAPLILVDADPSPYDTASSGRGVLVSESFAFRFQRKVGDELTLDTAKGQVPFRIVAIARDYT